MSRREPEGCLGGRDLPPGWSWGVGLAAAAVAPAGTPASEQVRPLRPACPREEAQAARVSSARAHTRTGSQRRGWAEPGQEGAPRGAPRKGAPSTDFGRARRDGAGGSAHTWRPRRRGVGGAARWVQLPLPPGRPSPHPLPPSSPEKRVRGPRPRFCSPPGPGARPHARPRPLGRSAGPTGSTGRRASLETRAAREGRPPAGSPASRGAEVRAKAPRDPLGPSPRASRRNQFAKGAFT